jgi:phosphoribosyl 1,2-cyclic phosphodiesterase
MLTKHTGMPVYGQKRTLQRLCDSDKIAANSPVIDMNGITINCGGCEVRCFNTPHDTIQSCGYRIHTSDDKHCAVCTDLGHITPEVDEALTGCRLVLLEANYDEEMLRTGPYPQHLKERIASGNGHLSNRACAEAIANYATPALRHVWLCHLSEENNHPILAQKTVEQILASYGILPGKDFLVDVLKRKTPSQLFELT